MLAIFDLDPSFPFGLSHASINSCSKCQEISRLSNTRRMSSIAVLGGGISGLSTAYYLSKIGKHCISKILLVESTPRVGGWVQTNVLDDGSLFEAGPRSIRGVGKAGHNTLELAEELGLTADIIPVPRSHPAAKNRFLYVDGKLCPLPTGIASVMKKSPPFSKPLFLLGMREPFLASKKMEDESVYDFFKRRFNEELAMYAADPLCRGVFAGDARQLSMKACFPPVFEAEQKYGSIITGMMRRPKDKIKPTSSLVQKYQEEHWAMWSLKKGLQHLPDTLATRLEDDPLVNVLTSSPCKALTFAESGIKLELEDRVENVDHVFSALPSFTLASLLGTQHQEFSRNLNNIPYVTVAVVNLLYDGKVLPVDGFGHLVPSTVKSLVLGALYESSIFPEHNRGATTRITMMMGGAWFEELFGDASKCSKDSLAQTAVTTAREQLNISIEPKEVLVNLQQKCIPQYLVGHCDLVDTLDGYVTDHSLPLSLVGAAYKGSSVNDCIRNARLEVDKYLFSDLSYVV